MEKSQKIKIVNTIKENLKNSNSVALVHYRGLSDSQLYQIRKLLKEKGCNIKIAKNTLLKIALNNTSFSSLEPYLNGPSAILYSNDIIALSKTISDFAKKFDSLKIRAALFNNSIIQEDRIKELAKLGSLEEVRSSFIGVLKSAQSNFVRIISAPEKGLATLKS